jgi:Domain of unknown function (DUF4926)
VIKEHDCVVLTANLPAERLVAGDVGTVMHIHNGGEGYEVEFMTLMPFVIDFIEVLLGLLRAKAGLCLQATQGQRGGKPERKGGRVVHIASVIASPGGAVVRRSTRTCAAHPGGQD